MRLRQEQEPEAVYRLCAPGPKFTATRPASLACKAARGIDSDTRERDAVSSSISNGHERLEGRTTNGLARNLGLALPPILTCMVALPALALEIHAEPSNALSLSTWAIHVSSVLEWVVAMKALIGGQKGAAGVQSGVHPPNSQQRPK
eukprot:gene4810-34564_t